MKLPNGENAYVDEKKLSDYILDFTHPRGRHKARLFLSILGIEISNQRLLSEALRNAARTENAMPFSEDQYGTRYTIRFELITATGSGTVNSAWMIRTGENFPRFVTCYLETGTKGE
ncbi:MAG: hypothetical protein SFY68_09350 [Candidatus Sumerlaeia bacterium]|nr:hypothetical protein [Candidatus Sumerlaeia bacterium]